MDKLFDDTKLKLFQKDLLFFGLNAIKYRWSAHDMDPHIEGYVQFDINSDDVVNRQIHLNYNMVSKPDYNHNNLADLILHELLHILHKHKLKIKDRNPLIWNLATDHVIDRTIKKWNLTKPYVQWNIIPELHDELPNCDENEAYMWLDKKIPKWKMKITKLSDGNFEKVEITDENGKPIITTIIQEEILNPIKENIIKNDIENFISDARALFNNLKTRGMESSKIFEYLNDVLKIEIPWETILRKAIKTHTIMIPTNRNWKTPNKFLRPLGFYLPGDDLEESKDNRGILVLHVDSSGSMSVEELKKACYVVMESLRYFEKIIVLVADIKIQQTKEFDKNDLNSFYEFIKEGIKGRGGTSHHHVFKWCQENLFDTSPEEFSLFISFTDCESDINSEVMKFEWCKKTPMIFLTTGTHKIQQKFKMEQIFIK